MTFAFNQNGIQADRVEHQFDSEMNRGVRMMIESGDSEETTSSSDSCGEEEEEESRMGDLGSYQEPVESIKVLKQRFDLPKGLCANEAVFNEFFSMDLWNELGPDVRQHLAQNFLPKFPENDREEKEITIQRFFNRESFRFGNSPLDEFQHNLEEGNYLLDVAKYKANIAKSERHEQRFQECERISQLAQKLAISRNRLLKHAQSTPFGIDPVPLKADKILKYLPPTLAQSAAVRAKKRYFN